MRDEHGYTDGDPEIRELRQRLLGLTPELDGGFVESTLYEAGRRAGRSERQRWTAAAAARLGAGFASGVAATLLTMFLLAGPNPRSQNTLAESTGEPQADQAAPRIEIHQERAPSLASTVDSMAFDLDSVVEQTLAKHSNSAQLAMRERFLHGDFETVSATPILTSGQWIQRLNTGSMELLD